MKHELATDSIKDGVHDKYMGELFSVGQKVKDIQKQTLFAELKAEITDINSNQLVNFRAAHAKSAYLYNQSVDSLQTDIKKLNLPFEKVPSWY